MRLLFYIPMFVVAMLITTQAVADQNASLLNSEMISLGPGPFNHGAGIGDGTNTTITGVGGFTGTFNANTARFSGTLNDAPGAAATWAEEADIVITQAGNTSTWENSSGLQAGFAPLAYDDRTPLSGGLIGVVPSAGTFDLEFIDTFDDAAGDVDAISTDVAMYLEEVSDTNGMFNLGSLNIGDSASSTGELAFGDIFDTYAITLNQKGILSFGTGGRPANGFMGQPVDTEIAVFDAAGNLLTEGDQGGPGGNDDITPITLEAGDYTLAVISFDGTFADGLQITSGGGAGDYDLTVSLAVPEPGTLAFLGFGCCGLLAYRRRR